MATIDALTDYMRNPNLPMEELIKRNDRLKKFGLPKEVSQHPPRIPDENATFIKDTLYLYGVDYMNTDEVKSYFKEFLINNVRWLNDSSCINNNKIGTVKFHSDEIASNAIEKFGNDPVEGMNELWKRGPITTISGRNFNIMFRFATDEAIFIVKNRM